MTAPQIDPAAFAAFIAQQQAQAPQAPVQQFAPQMPQAPAAPAGYPMQQYAPQMPQGYAPQMPQGYPMQQPQQPVQQLVPGTLDGFFSQPASGHGPAWSWKNVPMGTAFVGIVARPITNADISQQTQPAPSNAPMFYKDGRPVLVMKVPMNVSPDQTYTEGKAQWYVQGQARDELARAMAEAGAPAGPPEAGAVIWVTWVSERKNNFGTMSKQFLVKYQRPEGAAPAAPVAPVEIPAQAAPVAPPVAPVAPVAPPAPAAAPADMSPEQAALLAKLTGG